MTSRDLSCERRAELGLRHLDRQPIQRGVDLCLGRFSLRDGDPRFVLALTRGGQLGQAVLPIEGEAGELQQGRLLVPGRFQTRSLVDQQGGIEAGHHLPGHHPVAFAHQQLGQEVRRARSRARSCGAGSRRPANLRNSA